MKLAVCLAMLSVGAFSATLADEPQASSAQPSDAQASAPAAAATVAADTAAKDAGAKEAAAKEAAAKEAAATDALIKKMRGRGYKPVNRNGTLVFCRDEAEIGSHLQRPRCSTIDQMKEAELSGKEYVNSIQQQGSAVPFKGP
jgi:hypothetical protein